MNKNSLITLNEFLCECGEYKVVGMVLASNGTLTCPVCGRIYSFRCVGMDEPKGYNITGLVDEWSGTDAQTAPTETEIEGGQCGGGVCEL